MTNDEVVNDLANKIKIYRSLKGYTPQGEQHLLNAILEKLRFRYMECGLSPTVALNTVNALRKDVALKIGYLSE